jgi:hypothetical protein
MSADTTVEKLITSAIHTAFIKYPEGDGGPTLDYEWIPPEHSAIITKAIHLEGFSFVGDFGAARPRSITDCSGRWRRECPLR